MSCTVRGEESETESDREAERVCEAQRKDVRNRENSHSFGVFLRFN